MVMKEKQQRAKISVAEYVSQQIAMSGKSQKDIAAEAGFNKPNIITMFKQGQTKVPLDKIPLLAKALEVDPVHFLRIAMQEYTPETWDVIEKLIGDYLLTENEAEILKIFRDTGNGFDVAPKTEEERMELMRLVEKWRNRDVSLVNAGAKKKKERVFL